MTKLRHSPGLSSLGAGSCLTASFVLLACMGTETGNPIGDGSETGDEVIEGIPVGGECELVVTELEWDEDWQPSGFSGADVASHLPENLTTSLRWVESSSLSFGPESGLGEVELTIEPRGRAYLMAPEPVDGNDGPVSEGPPDALGDGCARMFHVETEIGLETADGALDERILTTFQSLVFADTAHAHFRVPVSELSGDFDTELELEEGQSLAAPLALEVELWLSPAGLTGELRIAAEVVDDDEQPVDFAPVLLGKFPAEQPCGLGAHLLDSEQSLHGFSPADVFERLEQASAAEWIYEHREGSVRLSWSLPPVPATTCVGVQQTGTAFLAPLSIEADDGSVNGTFTVGVTADTDGEGNYLSLQMNGGSYEQDIEAARDLGERYGLTDPASLDGYVGGMTDFIVDASGDPWGVFRYAGLTQDDCPSDGSGNCYGLIQTVLYGAHLGEPKNGYELDPILPE